MGKHLIPALACVLLLTACGGKDGMTPEPHPDPEHTLAVRVSPGISGSPAAGETRHKKGTRLSYAFTAQNGYEDLIVTLDGAVVSATGSVVMDTAHVLLASAASRVTLQAGDDALVTGAQAVATSPNAGQAYQQHLDRLTQLYRTTPLDDARRRVDAATLLAHDEVRDSARLRAAHAALGGRIFWMESPTTGSQADRGVRAFSTSAGVADDSAPVSILYINGIHNSPAAAASTAAEVAALAREAVGTRNVQIGHFYNVSWVSRVGPVVRCVEEAVLEDNPGIDLIGDVNRVYRCMDQLDMAEDLAEVTRQLLDVVGIWKPEAEQDAKVFAAAIQNEVHLGRRVVIVSHSQGNLMTQQALRRVAAEAPAGGVNPLRCIGVLRLAPPATKDWVSASAGHLDGFTIQGDVVFGTLLNDMTPFRTDRSALYLSAAATFDLMGLGTPARFVAGVKIHNVQKGYLRPADAGALVKTRLNALMAAVRQGEDCSGAQKQIFASSGQSTSSGPSSLYVVEPSAAGRDLRVAVLRTESGATPAITDLAWCPGGALYGLSFDALYEVGVTTGAMRRVGTVSGTGDANSMTCSPLGVLYVGAGQRLLRIDRRSATLTLLGATQSGSYSGDLAFARDGTLYGVLAGTSSTAGNDYLVRVDIQTGRTERVGTATLGTSGVWGLSFIDDQLYGLTTRPNATSGNLIRIDTSTGAATHVRPLSFNAFGSADALPPGSGR